MMEDPIHIVLLKLLLVAGVGGSLIWIFWSLRQVDVLSRRKQLEQFAKSSGWSFYPKKKASVCEAIPDSIRLHLGSVTRPINLIEGKYDALRFVCFDFGFSSNGDEYFVDDYRSCVLVEPGCKMDFLLIRKQEVKDAIAGQGLGVAFESVEFSKTFLVLADDERWAYDVIHPLMMEFLLLNTDYVIEFGKHGLFLYKSGLFSNEEFKEAIEIGCGIMERIPDFVKQELGWEQKVVKV